MNNHTKQTPPQHAIDQIIPFLWIRRGIGILSILLPFIMYFGNALLFNCWEVLRSVSGYYHTKLINVFVCIIAIIAIFLFIYRGPHGKDRHWSTLAAVLCFAIALFPTKFRENDSYENFVTYEC